MTDQNTTTTVFNAEEYAQTNGLAVAHFDYKEIKNKDKTVKRPKLDRVTAALPYINETTLENAIATATPETKPTLLKYLARLSNELCYKHAQAQLNSVVEGLGAKAVTATKAPDFGQTNLDLGKLGLWSLVAWIPPKRGFSSTIPSKELFAQARESFKSLRTIYKAANGSPLSDAGFIGAYTEIFDNRIKNIKAIKDDTKQIAQAGRVKDHLIAWYDALGDADKAANEAVAEYLLTSVEELINPEPVMVDVEME